MTSQSPDGRSLGELLTSVSEQSARLVRAEIELAKAELVGKAKELGIGSGMFAAAAVLGLYGTGTLVVTVILLFALFLPAWAAALVVTVVLFGSAVALVLVGKKKVGKGSPPVPQAAIDSLKHDVAAMKDAASATKEDTP